MSPFQLFMKELHAVFTNPALLLTVLGGVLFYSFLYPLPYVSQVPQEQQVVAVDLDGSQLSRTLVRMVDATKQVHISQRVASVEEAKELFISGKLAGMLVIPEHFYRDLLLGKRPSLSFAGDASYFLVYSTVLEGMVGAGQTLAAQVKISRLLMAGQAMQQAEEQYTAVKLRLHSLFNEAEGYVNYVIPAVFVLILHQTLLIGVALLAGTHQEQLAGAVARRQTPYWLSVSPLHLCLVRAAIFIGIYTLLSLYYFGPCLVIYDLPRLGSLADLLLFGLLFLLATTFLGIALGGLFKRRELGTLVVLLSSLPLVFTCGFIWPESAIPEPLVWLVQLIPAVPAIKGFVLLNQMGASLSQVLPQMWQLAFLGLGNFLAALLVLGWRKRQAAVVF